MKRIMLFLPKRNIRAVAELYEDVAPKTCKAVWNALPHEGLLIHAIWCGREVHTTLKPTEELKFVPAENQTVYPLPGEIMYGFLPANRIRGASEDVCDLAIFYGRDSRIYEPVGPYPLNHFATIVENLKEFAKASENLLLEGAERIVITKIK